MYQRKILAYLIGTVVMGATLAPWLFWAGQHISHFQQLNFLAGTDFQRYFDRSILVSAFLLLIAYLDRSSHNSAIFGCLTVVFFLLLLRTPRKP